MSVSDNQIVNFANYGIGVFTGHNNRVTNNRVLTSNRLADGSQIAKIWVERHARPDERRHDDIPRQRDDGQRRRRHVGQSVRQTGSAIVDSGQWVATAQRLCPATSISTIRRAIPGATDDEAAELVRWRQLLDASDVNVGLLPSAPLSPTNVVATASTGQATVTWDAPSSDGGKVITRYSIEASTDGGATWVTVASSTDSAASRTALISGLTNGAQYVPRHRDQQGRYQRSLARVQRSDAPHPAPSATTLPSGDVIANKALLRASVNPRGVDTTVSFLLGTDPICATQLW